MPDYIIHEQVWPINLQIGIQYSHQKQIYLASPSYLIATSSKISNFRRN